MVLRRIFEPTVSLAIWQRRPNAAATSGLTALLRTQQRVKLDFHAPALSQITAALIDLVRPESDTVVHSLRLLAADIMILTSLFGDVSGTSHPRLRIERVEDDGCALFHVDSLKMRMLCTYVGAGTQWIGHENARREELGSMGRTLDEANRAIVIDPSEIRSIPNWHVAIFKGRSWPDCEDISLIHRSAPVRRSDEHRLRICLALPSDCAC